MCAGWKTTGLSVTSGSMSKQALRYGTNSGCMASRIIEMKTFGNIALTYLEEENEVDVRFVEGKAGFFPCDSLGELIDYLGQIQDANYARIQYEIRRDGL
jgi:hypothetical protein